MICLIELNFLLFKAEAILLKRGKANNKKKHPFLKKVRNLEPDLDLSLGSSTHNPGSSNTVI